MKLLVLLCCVFASFPIYSYSKKIEKNDILNLIRSKKASRSDILQTFRNSYQYNYYMDVEDMETRILLLQLLYPNKIAVEIIGQSVQNSDIYMIIITDNALEAKFGPVLKPNSTNLNSTVTAKSQKPVIFIDAAMHAREWVSPAAAFYIIDKILESPYLTYRLEWRIVPMANPDGYVYTHTQHRYWRKNRGSTSSGYCVGVDVNRNFDFLWDSTNASPCSEVYGGKYPFSEPETRALRDAITHVADRAEAYISLHAFGQLILYPDGITRDAQEKLVRMARGIANRVDIYYGTHYKVAQTFVPGASSEWAFSNMRIPYSFTFELQPHSIRLLGNSGFQLSEGKLRNAADEGWTAVQYVAEQILLENRLRTNLDVNDMDLPGSANELESVSFDWKDFLQNTKSIRAEMVDKQCWRKNEYNCPLMIFWNSKFDNIFGFIEK